MKKSLKKRKTGSSDADHRTRSRLLEAAGIVFSEKGYDRAMAREICELARANPAAVNYHFGGKEKLYIEVLREAHRRLVDYGAIQSAVREAGGTAKEEGATEENIERLLRGLLHSMLDPSPAGWVSKLILREMTAPTKALEELVGLQIRPTSLLVRTLIGRFMDLPSDHPAVIRATLSAVSQFLFLFQNRRVIKMVLPELDWSPEGIDEMARHISIFTIAGLRAATRDVKRRGRK